MPVLCNARSAEDRCAEDKLRGELLVGRQSMSYYGVEAKPDAKDRPIDDRLFAMR